jgi:ACS family tartrate transporter-like MFS transporter
MRVPQASEDVSFKGGYNAMHDDKVFTRCARRLLPLMVVLYLFAWLDRVNVGFAALTMNADLGFSPTVFGFGAGVFFLGYFLFQVPANLLLARIGARRWIACIVLTWGALSAANALVESPVTFYVLRFLLGVAEAGLFPGMIFYLTLWFPQTYRARFTAIFMTAIPLANIIGGPVSSLILELDGMAGLRGWQWLFLIEGLPACVLALAVPKLMPDGPPDATWLDEREKAMISARLATEDAAKRSDLWPALHDRRVLVLCLGNFGIGFGGYGISIWLPQILQSIGYSNLAIGFVVAFLSIMGMAAMIAWGRSSDRRGERIWHVSLPLLVAAVGLIVVSLPQSAAVSLIAFTIIVVGLLAADGPFYSLPSAFLGGVAAAGGIALINAVGSLGAFMGPFVIGVLREETGSYGAGMGALAVCFALTAVLVLTLGRSMVARGIFPPAVESAEPDIRGQRQP